MPIYFVSVIEATTKASKRNHVLSNIDLESNLPEAALRQNAVIFVQNTYVNQTVKTEIIDSYFGTDAAAFRAKQDQYLVK